jgi:hypothetical protein
MQLRMVYWKSGHFWLGKLLGNAEEIGEWEEAQGARSAANETYQVDRRGSKNEVSAQANIGEADVKAAIAAGRSQHRALLRFARVAIYSAFP